jgi:hypothetical protein
MSRIKKVLFGTKRRKLATTLCTLALAGGGVALAAWLVSTTGSGAGRIGSLSAPGIAAGTAASDSACLPGSDCDGVFLVSNPNSVPLFVTGTHSAVGGIGSTSDPTGCPASNITVNDTSAAFAPIQVNAHASSTEVRIPNAFHLSTNAPSACQGVTFSWDVQMEFRTS